MATPIAYIYQRGHDALLLATVPPTRENTYTPEGRFVVAELGFEWQAGEPRWQVSYWAWRRPLDHRAARGKYLHRHKGRAVRRHALKPQRPLPTVSWTFSGRPPAAAGYIVRSLWLLSK